MKYTSISPLANPISKIVLGTDSCGTKLSREDSFRHMDYFHAQGGNCLDTARIYGKGVSEEVVGQWLKDRKLRHQFLISTKGAHPTGEHNQISRLSPQEIDSDLEASLSALNTDYVDIYFLHRDEEARPVSEIMSTLDKHVKSGKVLALGASNWSVQRIAQANRFALDNGMTPFSVSQIRWGMAFCQPFSGGDQTLVSMSEKEYDWYLKENMPVMAFSSQSGGFFQKLLKDGAEVLTPKLTRYLCPENQGRAQNIQAYTQKTGISVTGICMAYILSSPLQGLAVVGASSLEQLQDTLSWADVEIPSADLAKLINGRKF